MSSVPKKADKLNLSLSYPLPVQYLYSTYPVIVHFVQFYQ